MKILYVTTIGLTMTFFKELVRDLLDQGHQVDIICNEDTYTVPSCYRDWNCRIFHHNCARSPLSLGNIKTVFQIRKLVQQEKYDIVHCHTPIVSFCTRLACIGLRRKGVRVMYTAHGFHFYSGAPLKNWLLFYPAEKLCAGLTDVLITINGEDHRRAKRKLNAKTIEYVPGVGVDTDKFTRLQIDRAAKRAELGIPEKAFLLLSVGELNDNKNHQAILRAFAELNREDIHYCIAGKGPSGQALQSLARQLGVADRFHLLGFRSDVAELYKAADIFCFPSLREGLPVSVIEAMASGLPVVAAINRGTVELVEEGKNGFLCDYTDISGFAQNIARLKDDPALLAAMSEVSIQKAAQYSVSKIVPQMEQIYRDTLQR